MDERPSFRKRTDVRRLIIALLTPWVLGVLAYAGPMDESMLYSDESNQNWFRIAGLGWFFTFVFLAIFSPIAWFLFGVWRLLWRRGYRRSWYGWLWLFLMWLNLFLLAPAIAH